MATSTKNGVTWDMPKPGAIPGFNLIDTGAELQDAAFNAPAAAADRTAKIATDQAETQLAPLKVEQAKADVTKDSLASDDAMLARLAPILSGPMGAQALQNPQLRAVLDPILARRGIDGTNPEAIKAMVTPQVKPWAQWSSLEIEAARKLPPELRNLPPDAPEAFRTAPAQANLTATSENAIIDRATKAVDSLASAHSPPGQALAKVLSARQQLIMAGSSTAAIDQYLDPTFTKLSDGIKQQMSSDYAEAQIKKMEDLTGIAVDHERVYSALTKRRIAEFDSSDARANRALDIRQHALAVQAQARADNLAARWHSIDSTDAYRSFMEGQHITATQQAILRSQVGIVRDELDRAKSQLHANITAVANGADEDDLTQNSSDLKNTIQTLEPQYQALQSKLGLQPAADYQNLTGNKANPIKKAASDYKVGETYKGADGNTYRKRSDGKWDDLGKL